MFTQMTAPSIPEGIVRFTHALVEDASLRSWFLSLEEHSAAFRHAAFTQMAEQMQAEREDTELAAAVAAMTHPALFEAVRQSVRVRCGV